MGEIFPDKIRGPEIINEKMCIINNEKIIKSFCVVKLTVNKFVSVRMSETVLQWQTAPESQ